MAKSNFWLLVLVSPIGTVFAQQSQSGDASTRNGLVAALKHREGQIHSVICEFETVFGGTDEKMIPLIKQLCAELGESHTHFITPPGRDGRKSVSKWWGRSGKERCEVTQVAENAVTTTTAFDGQFVRQLAVGGSKAAGAIHTIPSAHWNGVMRFDPYSLQFGYCGLPNSELVARSMGPLKIIDGMNVDVFCRHPTVQGLSFDLRLSDEKGVLKRDIVKQAGLKKAKAKETVIERHIFNDFRAHTAKSGDTIWFPYEITRHQYLGAMPDGKMVEYASLTLRVLDIKFNVEISDDVFNLNFPPDIDVYDAVTGVGLVKAKRLPDPLPISQSDATNWFAWLSVALALILVICLTILWHHNRRRNKLS